MSETTSKVKLPEPSDSEEEEPAPKRRKRKEVVPEELSYQEQEELRNAPLPFVEKDEKKETQRRKVILTIKKYLEAFPWLEEKIPNEVLLESFNLTTNVSILQSVRLAVSNRNESSFTNGLFLGGVTVAEMALTKFGQPAHGLTAAVNNNEEVQDILKEIQLESHIVDYRSPYTRLAAIVATAAAQTIQANKLQQQLSERREKMQEQTNTKQTETIEESKKQNLETEEEDASESSDEL